MEKLIQSISIEIGRAFAQAGYAQELGKVTVSNRPDLCEYQCNGAMAGAKMYHKAPLIIAQEVAAKLADSAVVRDVCAAAPGFLNFNVSEQFLADYLSGMKTADRFGLPEVAQKALDAAPNPEGLSNAGFAFRFCATQPNVAMVLSGMNTMEQVEDNIRAMAGDPAPPV